MFGGFRSFQGGSRPCALGADDLEFHWAVGNGDAEGGTDGARDEIDLAGMGADQLGCDRKAEPAATGAAGGLECLEEVIAGLLGNAGPGVRDLDDRDGPLAPAGDTDLLGAV